MEGSEGMEPGLRMHWPASQSLLLAESWDVRHKGREEVSAQALLPGCSQLVSKGAFPSESTNQEAGKNDNVFCQSKPPDVIGECRVLGVPRGK